MIINTATAKKLLRIGKATEEGWMYDAFRDKTFAILTRHDIYRTDHYLIGQGDLRRN